MYVKLPDDVNVCMIFSPSRVLFPPTASKGIFDGAELGLVDGRHVGAGLGIDVGAKLGFADGRGVGQAWP